MASEKILVEKLAESESVPLKFHTENFKNNLWWSVFRSDAPVHSALAKPFPEWLMEGLQVPFVRKAFRAVLSQSENQVSAIQGNESI